MVSDKFCQRCGQRASVHKITFKDTINDFVESVFTINAPFFITLKYLVTNPGKLFREFLAGKRKRYYKPVAFFVLITVVYLLIRTLIDFDPFKDKPINAVDSETAKKLTLARDFMLLNINKLLFIFVFTLSVFLKLFFKKKYTWAEFMAIAFYLTGFYTILTTLNMFYIQYVDSTFTTFALFFMWAYFIYAMISFFQERTVWVFFKSMILFLFALLLYMAFAYGLSYLIVSIKN